MGTPTRLRGQAPGQSAVHTSCSCLLLYHKFKWLATIRLHGLVVNLGCTGMITLAFVSSVRAPTAGIEPATPSRVRINSPSMPANSTPMGIHGIQLYRISCRSRTHACKVGACRATVTLRTYVESACGWYPGFRCRSTPKGLTLSIDGGSSPCGQSVTRRARSRKVVAPA